jgi:hypothetical protein
MSDEMLQEACHETLYDSGVEEVLQGAKRGVQEPVGEPPWSSEETPHKACHVNLCLLPGLIGPRVVLPPAGNISVTDVFTVVSKPKVIPSPLKMRSLIFASWMSSFKRQVKRYLDAFSHV